MADISSLTPLIWTRKRSCYARTSGERAEVVCKIAALMGFEITVDGRWWTGRA